MLRALRQPLHRCRHENQVAPLQLQVSLVSVGAQMFLGAIFFGWCNYCLVTASLSHMPEPFLLCKGIADGRNIKCGMEGLAAAFHKFSRYASKIGVFRLRPLLVTLALCSLLSAMNSLHVKRLSRPRSSQGFTKGKRIEPHKTKDYAKEKNDYRTRQEGGHRTLPQLPQDRQCQRYEETLLRQGLPSGTLWQLHLQCVGRTKHLLSSNILILSLWTI